MQSEVTARSDRHEIANTKTLNINVIHFTLLSINTNAKMNSIKHLSLFLMYCLLSLPLTAQSTKVQSEEVTIKAMTYNTYSGRKMGIDKIADVINKENPDIVSLQEYT